MACTGQWLLAQFAAGGNDYDRFHQVMQSSASDVQARPSEQPGATAVPLGGSGELRGGSWSWSVSRSNAGFSICLPGRSQSTKH
jgi:hypothetical protein